MENNLVLKVNNLKTHFYLDEGTLKAVDEVSFSELAGSGKKKIGRRL